MLVLPLESALVSRGWAEPGFFPGLVCSIVGLIIYSVEVGKAANLQGLFW